MKSFVTVVMAMLVLAASAAQAEVPDAPKRVRQFRVDDAHVLLTWQDRSDDEEGFEILRRPILSATYESRGTVGPNTTEFLDETPKDTIFIYRVVAFNEDGDSGESNQCYVNRSRPSKPLYFNVRLIALNVSRVRWSDRSNGERGFALERADFPSRRFKTVAVIPPNTEVYDDYTLDPARTYTYRLRALGRPQVCWKNSYYTPERTLTTKGGVRILQVELAGRGRGTIVSEPYGIICGVQGDRCAAEFPLAEDIVLTAKPRPASHFGSWSVYGRCDGSKNEECVVTMTEDRVVGASFKANR